MAFVNFATREITAKIVYYGPGLGGKTTSLQFIHTNLPSDNRGKMISLATEEDRTIYFDFLPLNLGRIQDFAVRVQLYTVPGQVRYNATRKLVLRGADGLVFVADSQNLKKVANTESFNNMEENLRELGKELRDLPHVLQFNKVDLPNIMSSEDLNQLLNRYNVPFFETIATTGVGVLDSLKSITKLVFNDLSKKALLQKKGKTTTGAAAQYTAFAEKPATQPVAAAAAPVAAPQQPPPPQPSFYASTFSEATENEIVEKIEDTYGESVYRELDLDEEKHDDLELEPLDIERVAPVETVEDTLQEVEPIAEFDETPEEEITYVESDLESFGQPAAAEPVIQPTVLPKEVTAFTYSDLFENDEALSETMTRLQAQIVADDSQAAVATAREAYSYMINHIYPQDLIVDRNETTMIFAAGIKFRRFVRFKRLLDSRSLHPSQLLFLHHFLCDLYLSLKEL